MTNKITGVHYTPIQLKLPVDLEKIIKINDPVYSFTEVMAHIDLHKYFVEGKEHETGRPRYDREKLLKIVLFAFMEFGYCSIRSIKKLCETDIRFMWLTEEETPSHMTICHFIRQELSMCLSDIFDDMNRYIFEKMDVDLNHVYIDGTKLKANAHNYSWVWKKSCINNRNKVFAKITKHLTELNETYLIPLGLSFEIRQEYSIEYVEYMLEKYLEVLGLSTDSFVRGKGKRRSQEQRMYEQLFGYCERLKRYAEHINICGEKRGSYSKTDNDATFMRVKRDYMGNDQLLPAYNLQLAVADEFVAHYGVFAYASDMDCFQPLMGGFYKRYGFYPKYPVADAGYGSYNNYLYCQEKGNQFGRTEEYYQCEDCTGCPHREKCHKSKDNRIVRINEELTQFHSEVLANLNCVHGALLRMNRSIQSEGAFGGIRWNRQYQRIRRRGIEGVILELRLICCGFNLHKFHLKQMAAQKAA